MPTIEWGYFVTIGLCGVLALVIQLLVFRWENRSNTARRGLTVPVTLRQVLWEWATYMLIIIVVSMVLQGPLHLTCWFC